MQYAFVIYEIYEKYRPGRNRKNRSIAFGHPSGMSSPQVVSRQGTNPSHNRYCSLSGPARKAKPTYVTKAAVRLPQPNTGTAVRAKQLRRRNTTDVRRKDVPQPRPAADAEEGYPPTNGYAEDKYDSVLFFSTSQRLVPLLYYTYKRGCMSKKVARVFLRNFQNNPRSFPDIAGFWKFSPVGSKSNPLTNET